MIGLLRIALIMIIIFLLQRAFSGSKSSEGQNENSTRVKANPGEKRGSKSKELGEYVDYEEIDKKD